MKKQYIKNTLAFALKPKTIKDVIGQTHLINDQNGLISRMIKERYATSLIFYGKPGIGKSSIALALAHDLKLPFVIFNAALDKKQTLQTILDQAQQQQKTIIIVEEIHRMNRDRQDVLLQSVEQGHLIMFACTTENPFFVINPALRSRAQLIKLEPITEQQMIDGLKKMIQTHQINLSLGVPQLKLVSKIANGDLRIALNILDLLINLYPREIITNEIIKSLSLMSNLVQDKDGDEHYDLLSAFQKSIRGSDVDAALHYLARLISGGDFQALTRRMLIISYEDVGLANPIISVKVKNAIDTFFQIGMPEGIIPLGLVTIEMALSEKSNSAYQAVKKAHHDVQIQGQAFSIPKHLRDSHYHSAKKMGHGIGYKYAHDYPYHFVKQQYLPQQLVGKKYYQPQLHNLYEKKLAHIYHEFTTKK